MEYIVFIKQVPASTNIYIDPETNTLVRAGAKAQVNPYDLHALQAAVEMKTQTGGTITVVSMGPPQAEAALREAMVFGADEAVLLSDRAFAGSDTWSTSAILAAAVRKLAKGDVLLFGKQAIDGDTAQVGPGVAAQLDLPQLTDLVRICELGDKDITLEKRTDRGVQKLRVTLPCAVTVTKEANKLPHPTIRQWEAAQTKPLIRWGLADLQVDPAQIGLAGSPTRVVRTGVPERAGSVRMFETVQDLATLIKTLETV